MAGVIRRQSHLVTSQGLWEEDREEADPPSHTPTRHLLPWHPLAASGKQSHMPLFSSVKGICCLPLAYKSIKLYGQEPNHIN